MKQQPAWRMNILKNILFIGSITLSVFTFVYSVQGNYWLALIEGVSSLVLIFAIYLTSRGFYTGPAYAGWVGVFVVLLTLLFTGGIGGAGLIWWALIPVISFMMFGLNIGTIAVVASVVVLVVAALLREFSVIPIYFDAPRLIQSSVAVMVLGGIMYYFEKISSVAREDALAESSLLLAKDIEIEKNLKQLESEKENQIKVRLAMLNLLEDSKELEVRLNEEKEKATAIISSMGEGLFVLDDKHQLELINPVAEKLLGISHTEAIGKDWAEIATTLKGDAPIKFSERSTMQALASGKPVTTNINDNHYYQTKSGKKFPIISITTPLIKNNKVVGVIKVFKDVTADKHSKEVIEQKVVERTRELRTANEEISKGWLNLQQEKAKLSASIENMPVGFLMVDITGDLIVVNSLADKILHGKNNNDTYDKLKTAILSKFDLINYIQTCNQDTKTISLNDITLLDGRIIKVVVAPILSDTDSKQKKCVGIVVLIEDVTEAKILERSKDEFFSIASHELRTPLTAIRGNTSMMKDMYASKLKDPELIEMIDDVHTSAIRLINIVNDFLNVSRLEMGKIDFKKAVFDLVPLSEEVITELTDQASQKKLVLKMSNPKIKSLNVFSDRDRTKEVLINLIGNAIKYTDKGEIIIDFISEKESTKVLVRDTGNGITPEGQKLLFHKFQQAGSSILTRDATRSTGLGLYISKLIVEGMGGTIQLESSIPGKGSTFSFTLPSKPLVA